MSQRDSGYERKERDLYETPEWVTHALFPHLSREDDIWEPAAATGKMVQALVSGGYTVVKSGDIDHGDDFFDYRHGQIPADAIVTNPPYEAAEAFIRHALEMMQPGGRVAMLLRTDYDHAKTRRDLFTLMPFAKKLVLTKRIKWFEESKGQPSFNHAWFIWDWKHSGPPTLAYGP